MSWDKDALNSLQNGDGQRLQKLSQNDDAVSDAPPTISVRNTIIPRHLVASLDNLLAMIVAIVVGKNLAIGSLGLKTFICLLIYLGYFFVLEGLAGRTIGKFLAGLVVVQLDGRRCTWSQALTRTLFRLLEVDPFVFGAIPAALSIIFSERRQRFGDKVAKTLVVESRRVPRNAV